MNIKKVLLATGLTLASINSGYAEPKPIENVWKSEVYLKEVTGFYSQALEGLKQRLTRECRYLPGTIYKDGNTFRMKSETHGCNSQDRKYILQYQSHKLRGWAVLGTKVAAK